MGDGPTMALHGSCLCGGIGYECGPLTTSIRHCSCNVCRKAHAASFNSSAGVDASGFRWVRGEDLLGAYASSPGKTRFFCTRCGSPLVARRDGSDTVILRVGSLDVDPGRRPTGRIWMDDAKPWLEDGPDLPHHAGWADRD